MDFYSLIEGKVNFMSMPVNKILARGVGASPGVIEGKVVVVREISDLSKVQNGDIIVVLESNPAWIVGMMKASALISEFGGIICHAAIIAREMGIPCVVDVENATQIVQDGMYVTVDGKEGIIYESRR